MNPNYFERRAQQERHAAQRAADIRARRCHEQLAALHATARGEGGESRSGEETEGERPCGAVPNFIVLGLR